MEFRIAETFIHSLDRLTNDERKVVKTTVFDLQLNPANPGIGFHRVDSAKDINFWSVTVSTDIRLIVHRKGSSLLVCYVGHHDDAYQWARRRRLDTHPTTGAIQLVEVRETVQEVSVAGTAPVNLPAGNGSPLSDRVTEEELLGYGVPPDWLRDVMAATEDTILEVAEHLPEEAAEAVLDLAVGVTPRPVQPPAAGVGPFDHPDAKRRFRPVDTVDDLERALELPWENAGGHTVTLHEATADILRTRPGSWVEFRELADLLAEAGTYLRADGEPPPPSQLRLRAKNYPHMFEIRTGRPAAVRLLP